MIKLLRKSGIALLAVALALLFAEWIARAFVPPIPYANRNIIEHPSLGWCMRPGLAVHTADDRGKYLYETTASGFRGPRLPSADEAASPGVKRVLFLGDSFLNAWAVRVEERMQERTAALLNERDVPTEVYTLSCDGYGTMQELMLLRKYGARIAPDVIVLTFFSGNDFVDNTIELAAHVRGSGLNYIRPYAREGGARRGADAVYPYPFRSFLRHRSRLFRTLEKKCFLETAVDAQGRKHPWPTERLVEQERVEMGMLPEEQLGYLVVPEPASAWAAAWSTTERLLSEVAAEVEALGARLLVLVIPANIQVFHGASRRLGDSRYLRWGGEPLGQVVDWNLPERRLAAHFAREGIEARFLCEPFRAATLAHPTEEIYGPDAHLVDHGHRIAAEFVADWCDDALAEDGAERRAISPRPAVSGDLLTEPVDLHAALGAAALWQNYRSQRSSLYVARSAGWKHWQPAREHVDGGWEISSECKAVLPARIAPVVLRGSPPPRSEFPVTVSMHLPYHPPTVEIVLEQPGEFELVYEPRELARTDLEDYGDSVLMIIRSSAGSALEGRPALIIHELGFRSK